MYFRKGVKSDIEQLAQLYDDLNDHLNSNINYPGQTKEVYPVRENAANGVSNGNLYVAEQNNKIVRSISELVKSKRYIPEPRKFIGAFDGYRFYETTVIKYAIKE